MPDLLLGDQAGLSRRHDGRTGGRQWPAVLHSVGLGRPGTLDLLGHVGQVEVQGEGAGHGDGLVREREPVDDALGLPRVLSDEPADPLDHREQLHPLLAQQGLAQKISEAADVLPQARGGAQVGQGHRSVSPGSWVRSHVVAWARTRG